MLFIEAVGDDPKPFGKVKDVREVQFANMFAMLVAFEVLKFWGNSKDIKELHPLNIPDILSVTAKGDVPKLLGRVKDVRELHP